MIYFLVVNYYSGDAIANLISSIPANENVAYQISIVNNSPDDDSISHLKFANVQILEAGANLGFGKACNLGLNWIYNRHREAIVWIINPDTFLLSDVLEKIYDFFAAYPEISILGTIIYTKDRQVWFAGGDFIPATGAIVSQTVYRGKIDSPYLETAWVSGCSLLVNLKNFSNCPEFDRDYFLYYEDFDFCRRYASQGHLVAITDKLAIVHEVSAITGRNMTAKFKHSTYSYLLTIERYTSKLILIIRFVRLLLNAIYLIFIQPKTGFGKL